VGLVRLLNKEGMIMVLQLKNISKKYKHKQVLNDINLTFEQGEVVFVLGESGCGKTTLLNIVGGLESVDSGSIILGDRKITHNDSTYIRLDVAFVFQEHNLIAGLTVEQNIALASSQLSDQWIEQNTSKYGINSKQKVQYLSGGESQRVALLRCLYKDATIILADEPTGSLDNKNRDRVFGDICSLKQHNKIVVVVSHDEDSAYKYADRIIRLQDGRVESDDKIHRASQVDIEGDVDNLARDLDQNQLNEPTTVSPKMPTATVSMPIQPKLNRKGRLWSDCVLTKNAIYKHWVRMLGIVILLSFSLSFVAQSWALKYDHHPIDNGVAKRYQVDMTRVNDWYNNEYGQDMPPKVDIDAISRLPNVGDVQEYYMQGGQTVRQNTAENSYSMPTGYGVYFSTTNTRQGLFFANSEGFERLHLYGGLIQQVGIDNTFWHNRVMSDDVRGEYIANDNEIIIGLDVAQMLFDNIEYAVGSEIYVWHRSVGILFSEPDEFEYDKGIPATIVGINHTVNNAPITKDITEQPSRWGSDIRFSEATTYTYMSSGFAYNFNDISMLYDGSIPRSVEVYLNDHLKYASVIDRLSGMKGVERVVSVYQEFRNEMNFYNREFGESMLASALIFNIVLLIVIFIFVKISDKQRRYEMVVLKSLGYSKLRIFVLFCYDLLFCSIVALLASFAWDRLYIWGFVKMKMANLGYLHMTSVVLISTTTWLAMLGICVVGVLCLTTSTIFGKVSKGLKISRQ
jgi:putative ABC transport system ATP-binding protein